MKTNLKNMIGSRAVSLPNRWATAQRLSLAVLCGLLLSCSSLAQESQPEEWPTPEQSTTEATTEKAPDPNEALVAAPLANQSVDGDIVFTSPGQFIYPRDIRLSDNFGGLRFYGANSLTTTPAGAAIQFFGNNAAPFGGQLFLDSGALNSAALIFRTATTGATITERMRVTAGGRVLIGTTASPTATERLLVVNNGVLDGIVGETNANGGSGVLGISKENNGFGVRGLAFNGPGVRGFSTNGTGVEGQSSGGLAGRFVGNVQVTGTLSKGGGSFKIDHPLDPRNKYLSHSFVESPDMMNIYNGNVTLDAKGEAVVTLPDWFEALNREFRYQLTALGAPGPNLYVAAEIKSNTFQIAGGRAGMKVSWQVTGVRQDAYANQHRIAVEEDKPAQERGFYLHPEAFGQPVEKGIAHARSAAATPQPEEGTGKGTNAAKRTAPSPGK